MKVFRRAILLTDDGHACNCSTVGESGRRDGVQSVFAFMRASENLESYRKSLGNGYFVQSSRVLNEAALLSEMQKAGIDRV